MTGPWQRRQRWVTAKSKPGAQQKRLPFRKQASFESKSPAGIFTIQHASTESQQKGKDTLEKKPKMNENLHDRYCINNMACITLPPSGIQMYSIILKPHFLAYFYLQLFLFFLFLFCVLLLNNFNLYLENTILYHYIIKSYWTGWQQWFSVQ